MRKTTLILAFLAIVACGGAQDFLTPESYGIYSSNKHGNETLFQLMFPEDKSGNVVWDVEYKTFFLCAPSFSAEYALEIGKNQLILTKANQNIYTALSRHLQDRQPNPLKVVSVDIKKMSVSEEVCKRLSELFNLATMTATHIESKHSGFDGTTILFQPLEKIGLRLGTGIWTHRPIGADGRSSLLRRRAQRHDRAEPTDEGVWHLDPRVQRGVARTFFQTDSRCDATLERLIL